MPKRKRKIEDPPIIQSTEEIPGEACSQGYDMEVPAIRSLIVDAGTLEWMRNGKFRPVEMYDQVNFQAVDVPLRHQHFSLFLAFKAVRPGGLLWVRPELAKLRMFNDCQNAEIGGMVRITKQ